MGYYKEEYLLNLNVMSLVREHVSSMILRSDVAEFAQYFLSDSSNFLQCWQSGVSFSCCYQIAHPNCAHTMKVEFDDRCNNISPLDSLPPPHCGDALGYLPPHPGYLTLPPNTQVVLTQNYFPPQLKSRTWCN